MTLKASFLIAALFLASNSLFAQDAGVDNLTAPRHQAMDEEVRKLTALREKQMDEAVYRLSGVKEKPRFFFTLRGRPTGSPGLKTVTL